jgi:hypothetical protein
LIREPVELATMSAPLFRGLIERMNDDMRRVVMDLGPARPETVAAFGRFRCRLDIADIAEQIAGLNAAADPASLRRAMAGLLPRQRAEATDIVLCWDLLNYLERPALTAVMSEIRARLGRGALVHALIVYSTPRMAAVPGRIFPGEDDRLVHLPLTREEKAAPRYSPDDFSRCMPGYVVERAMLLRNGMQEFLFRA